MPAFLNSGSAAANGVFRPSLVVNLQILFDQGLQEKQEKIETTSARELGTKGGDPSFPVSAEKGGKVAPISTTPEIMSETGTKKFSKVINLVPLSATIELPSYRQAGTFELEFLHRDFPLDPRVVRALRAEIHLGTVEHMNWSDGILGRTGEGKRRTSVLKPSAENLVIVGMADTLSSDFSERSSTVRIEGRDLRGILLDANVAPEVLEKIDLKKPLDEVVRTLVNKFHPQGKGIDVAALAKEWPNGKIPSPHVAGDLTRPQFDADPVVANKAQAGNGETCTSTPGNPNTISYWDMVTQWCLLCGGVPYFVGAQLRIRPARTLYDQRKLDTAPFDPSFPYPFTVAGKPSKREVGPPLVSKPESPFGYRRLVFGKDIAKLKFERKLGGVVVPAIRVVSYDGDNTTKGAKNRLIEATYPPEDDDERRACSVGSSGKKGKTEEIYFPVYGIKNKDRLEEIARALHAEIGRQELGGSISTKNLASFGGTNQDPDLLKLRPGDPIELRSVATGLQTYPSFNHELLNHESQSFEEEVDAVAKRLGDRDLAFYLVATARDNLQQLTRTFRTSNVRYSWDTESGVSIDFDFQNFVEVRYTDPDETAGTAITVTPSGRPTER